MSTAQASENRHQWADKVTGAILAISLLSAAFMEYEGSDPKIPYTIAVVALGLLPLLLKRQTLNSLRFAVIYFAAVSLLFTMPLLRNFDYWGFHDWDYHTFVNALSRTAILEYHQIPFWNPYSCGGNILLANPQSEFMSPFFTIVLLFGEIYGLKIQIIVHTFVGLVGFYILSRHLGLRNSAAYLPPVVYMCNSFYSLHLTVGHSAWMATCWLPYVFLYYRMSHEQLKYALPAGLFAALMYIEAHAYLFAYTMLFLGLHTLFKLAINFTFKRSFTLSKKARPAIALAVIVAAAFSLGAVKMLPTLMHTMENPHSFKLQPGYTLETLTASLIDASKIDTSVYWHNQSAYIGLATVMLAAIGIFLAGEQEAPLALALFTILWISFSTNAPINLWQPIHELPVYQSLRNPTRLIMVTSFIMGILAGFGLKGFESLNSKLAALILAYCVISMVTTNGRVFYEAFTIKPYSIERAGTGFQQTASSGKTSGQKSGYYPNFLANQGYLKCYEPVKLKGNYAVDYKNKDYRGEAYVLPRGRANITYFTPNKVVVKAEGPGKVVLNQNYANGWLADGRPAIQVNGLVGAEIGVGTHEVAFTYLPPGLYPGAALTALGIVLTAVILGNVFPRSRVGLKTGGA